VSRSGGEEKQHRIMQKGSFAQLAPKTRHAASLHMRVEGYITTPFLSQKHSAKLAILSLLHNDLHNFVQIFLVFLSKFTEYHYFCKINPFNNVREEENR
jgi:hypothetical protein